MHPVAGAAGDPSGPGAADELRVRLEHAIRALLAARSGSICPSDAARAVGGAQWRPLMGATRQAAGALAERGEVIVTQRGSRVDPATARGPIRINRVSPAGEHESRPGLPRPAD